MKAETRTTAQLAQAFRDALQAEGFLNALEIFEANKKLIRNFQRRSSLWGTKWRDMAVARCILNEVEYGTELKHILQHTTEGLFAAIQQVNPLTEEQIAAQRGQEPNFTAEEVRDQMLAEIRVLCGLLALNLFTGAIRRLSLNEAEYLDCCNWFPMGFMRLVDKEAANRGWGNAPTSETLQ